MFQGKFFKTTFGIILILLIIFLVGQIPYVMEPITKVFYLLFTPILIGGFLYYLFRPIVRYLISKIKNKNLSILITFIIVLAFVVVIFYFGGSIIYNEVKKLIDFFSTNYENIIDNINGVINSGNGNLDFLTQFEIADRITHFIETILTNLSNYNFIGAFSSLTSFTTIIILIPFALFYLLKDDEKFYNALLSFIPKDKKEKTNNVLKEIDKILSAYIGGQLIVAFILGIIFFIGYLIIGIQNALGLALIAMICSLVPILGPTVGTLPAFFMSFSYDFFMVIKVIIVFTIIQQLEGNLVRPLVQGERLRIHPLIILFLVMICVLIFGLLGALFAVPAYAVVRVIIKNIIELKKEKNKEKI